MIDVTVRVEGSEGVREKLTLLAHPDLRPLLDRIAAIVKRGTDRDRAAGLALGGGQLDPIKESTERRRTRAGRGSGPPLYPDEASRFARLRMEVSQPTPESGLIVGDWPGTEAFIRYHIEGVPGRMAARDPVFLSTQTLEEIRAEIRSFYVDLLARNVR